MLVIWFHVFILVPGTATKFTHLQLEFERSLLRASPGCLRLLLGLQVVGSWPGATGCCMMRYRFVPSCGVESTMLIRTV